MNFKSKILKSLIKDYLDAYDCNGTPVTEIASRIPKAAKSFDSLRNSFCLQRHIKPVLEINICHPLFLLSYLEDTKQQNTVATRNLLLWAFSLNVVVVLVVAVVVVVVVIVAPVE
ncbi:Hypothetical predicted protein [Octopus vulgaris]|uniref:Uncharacterized protein n=1 Tax=Octopus vulgaris TaxID=6645 RepID=A0AA36AN88_OCTVU|nr:Hypothetical predicted protein [Octopus vulgaris]